MLPSVLPPGGVVTACSIARKHYGAEDLDGTSESAEAVAVNAATSAGRRTTLGVRSNPFRPDTLSSPSLDTSIPAAQVPVNYRGGDLLRLRQR